jgi:hypothetical protein
MTTVHSPRTAPSTYPTRHPRTRARALAVAAATLAPLVVWLVAVPLAGATLQVRPGGGSTQTVPAGTVVVVALLASLAGWTLLAVLERRTIRARAMWTVIALIALLLSLAGPLTAAATATTAAVLVSMHLAVAGVLLTGLRRS